jgi:DNA-binding NtrC family response regulator
MDVDTWRILVVVREAAKLRLLGWHLASERALDVTLADRAGVGLELLRSAAFDLLISDVSAPGMDEYDVWEELGELAVRRGLPVMWLETDDPARSARAGHATATSDFLPKSFTPHDLLGRVRVQLALLRTRHELQEERARLDQELDSHARTRLAMDCLSEELSSRPYPEHIAGISPATARLRELVEAAARSDRPVLIVGETGTGKETTARAIHNRSVRRERPFIKLNCAALAKDAMQEELCGDTQSGADTAELKQLQGRLEFVQGGTLLLAEVGELPLACQDKLARVLRLQDRERKRSGSPGRFDARVVATTSRDLLPLVKAGAFRPDLSLPDCKTAL